MIIESSWEVIRFLEKSILSEVINLIDYKKKLNNRPTLVENCTCCVHKKMVL
jgi:hypothetical protein